MQTEAKYFGPARSNEEFESARLLAESILEFNTPAQGALEFKRFLWGDPFLLGLDHVIIAASSSGEILGVVRLVPHFLRRAFEVIKVAGISSVCVAESQRNRGLARLLIDTALKQAKALGYELSVLFARRAVDHLYPRFDIWGLASYSKLTITKFPCNGGQLFALMLRELKESDLPLIAGWHKSSYGECFGWFERSVEQWRFILQFARLRRLSPFIAEIGGAPVGYVVVSGHRVMEVAFESSEHGLSILHKLSDGADQLLIDLPFRHKLLSQLQGCDFTMSSRRCEYGGHMVGVLNRTKACMRLASRVSQRALALRLPPCQEKIDGLIVNWDGQRGTVQIESLPTQQPLGLNTTSRLVGAILAGATDSSLLAPAEPITFLSLDEF